MPDLCEHAKPYVQGGSVPHGLSRVLGKFVPFHQTGNRAAVRASYSRALPIELLSTEPAELSAVPEKHDVG